MAAVIRAPKDPFTGRREAGKASRWPDYMSKNSKCLAVRLRKGILNSISSLAGLVVLPDRAAILRAGGGSLLLAY